MSNTFLQGSLALHQKAPFLKKLSWPLTLICGASVVAAIGNLSWWLAFGSITVTILLEVAGQLILFTFAYKGWERWRRHQGVTLQLPLRGLLAVVTFGYLHTIWVGLVVVVLLHFLGLSLLELLHVLTVGWLAASILLTFLAANPRSWRTNTDAPLVLGLGFGLQLVFFLLVKLL